MRRRPNPTERLVLQFVDDLHAMVLQRVRAVLLKALTDVLPTTPTPAAATSRAREAKALRKPSRARRPLALPPASLPPTHPTAAEPPPTAAADGALASASRSGLPLATASGSGILPRVPRTSPSPVAADDWLFNPAVSPAGSADAPVLDAAAREASVFEAVRYLIRATATEVAGRCGFSYSAAYAELQALVAAGRLARLDGGRGIEYSLVSTGEIRPFKRQRNAG